MAFDLGRLRKGEWVIGGAALVLLLSLFLLDWYGSGAGVLGQEAVANGWESHTILRWFMLLTIAGAFALVVVTAVRDTTAVPATMAPVVTAFAMLTTLLLAYRVLIDEPGPNEFTSVKAGAWIGLLACAAIVYGGYLSMRDESGGTPPADVPARRLSAS